MVEIADRQVTTGARASVGFALRQALPVTLGLILIWLLYRRVGQLDTNHLFAAFDTVAIWQWVLALGLTWVSFGAVGRYDVVLHRLFATPIAGRQAARGGKTAIALSQALGLGVLTGAIARWRMLPGLSFLLCLSLSLAVALSFLGGWALVTAIVLLAFPVAQVPHIVPLAILAATGVSILILLWQPNLYWRGRRINLPPLAAMVRLPWLAAIDTIAAGLAFWVLLPPEIAIPFTALLPAFLVALGAGIVSGTPGGVGAFEVTLMAFLPDIPQAPLLAAILAFRLVYYAAPAALASLAIFLGPRRDTPLVSTLRAPVKSDIDSAPFAEANLLSTGELAVLRGSHGAPLSMVAQRGQSLIVLGPALTSGAQAHALRALREAASRGFLQPCFYKADARLAVTARQGGWAVRAISADAVLCPQDFKLDRRECRQLRRKLRQAEKAGVTVRFAETNHPTTDMTRLSTQWTAANGGERGFSMGRYTPCTVASQRVYLAYSGPDLVGFATFNITPAEWSLDLMRTGPDTPPGTMHALIVAAINDAAILQCPTLSLAAAPLPGTGPRSNIATALRRFCRLETGDGLYQFKASFAPTWRRLYIATPGKFGMIVSGFDVLRAIVSPCTRR